MEHPGRNWNRIECWCNQYLGKILPAQVLRWLWVLVHTAAGGYILLLTLFGSLGYVLFLGAPIHELCKETIVAADPAVINPANEGRLVRLCGQLTTTEWVTDPLTGVQARTPWLVRSAGVPLFQPQESEKIVDKTFYAQEWRLGVFRIPHYRPDYHCQTEELTADQLQFTQPAEGYQVTPPQPGDSGVLLSSSQGEPLCYIWYYYYSGPVYIVARQCGDQLLMGDPAASFSYYKPSAFSSGEAFYCLVFLLLGSGGHFIILCLAFSCFRSAQWHATKGRDLFRLPLCLASGLVVGIFCCLYCGIYLVSGNFFHIDLTTNPAHVPGALFLAGGLGLLAYLWKRWREASPAAPR